MRTIGREEGTVEVRTVIEDLRSNSSVPFSNRGKTPYSGYPKWSGNIMKQALEDALVSDKRMSLKAIAQQLGCTTAVLYKRFPDLSQAVVTRYRGERIDKEQIRQQLQDMLRSSEKMPSINQVTYSHDIRLSAGR